MYCICQCCPNQDSRTPGTPTSEKHTAPLTDYYANGESHFDLIAVVILIAVFASEFAEITKCCSFRPKTPIYQMLRAWHGGCFSRMPYASGQSNAGADRFWRNQQIIAAGCNERIGYETDSFGCWRRLRR
jgi:hypothetical protein